MSIEVDAIYENGVLRPRNPLPIGNRQHVYLRIDVKPMLLDQQRLSKEEVDRILDSLADGMPEVKEPFPENMSRESFYED